MLSISSASLLQNKRIQQNDTVTIQLLNIAEIIRAGIDQTELAFWNQDNFHLLPQGYGTLHHNKGSDFLVSISWQDHEGNKKQCEHILRA